MPLLYHRTKQLDAWFRDVCYYYRDMPAPAREAVRLFLNFDMKATKDIFVHDQLAWGTIEPNKVDAPVLIVRKSTVVNLHDSAHDTNESAASIGTQKSVRYNLKQPSQTSVTEKLTPTSTGSSASAASGILSSADIRSMNGSILRAPPSGRAMSVA
jgi:hypothetical protein